VTSVLEYLVSRAAPFLVLPFPGGATPGEAASAHGIGPDELVRVELVVGVAGNALMVVPSDRALEPGLAQEALRDPSARPAIEDEVRAAAPGCLSGTLPPLSRYIGAPMFVDPAVADLPQVVFAAGTPSVLVCMQREDLFRDDPYAVVPLTAASSSPEHLLAPSRRAILAGDTDLVPVHVEEQRRRSGEAVDVRDEAP
jgi:prolyl-tRNA editing enzyme YbaK/EbsC (Cys-tRNA(Pro) deacylase)